MPCEALGGCSTVVHTSNTAPGATDDGCNNSGLGYFCQGSFWIYDPTLPGATEGACPKMWLRSGDTCNVAEWIEVCLKDQINHLLLNDVPDFVRVDILDGTVTGTTINMDNAVIPVTNSGCEDMDVCIRARLWGVVTNYETHPGYVMLHDFRLTVDFGTGAQFAHVVSAQNRVSGAQNAHSNNDGEVEYCFVLPAGTTQNVTINIDYVCNGGGPCAAASYEGFNYTIEGHTQ